METRSLKNILSGWKSRSALFAEAQTARRKPSAWLIAPIAVLVYIIGLVVAAVCMIPLTAHLGAEMGHEQLEVWVQQHMLLIMLYGTIPITGVFLLYVKVIERRSLASVGFTRKGVLLRYLRGLGWGAAMILAALAIACLTGGMRFDGLNGQIAWGALLLFFIGFLFQGMSEEVICRGVIMVSAANRAPLWIGVALNSVLFAAMHLFNNGLTVLSFVNLILFGLFASAYFLRMDSVWGIGALHTAWNFFQGNVLGIEVSGQPVTETVAHFSAVEGSAPAFSGGAFGLEGSIATTIVFGAGIVLLVFLPRRNRPDHGLNKG